LGRSQQNVLKQWSVFLIVNTSIFTRVLSTRVVNSKSSVSDIYASSTLFIHEQYIMNLFLTLIKELSWKKT